VLTGRRTAGGLGSMSNARPARTAAANREAAFGCFVMGGISRAREQAERAWRRGPPHRGEWVNQGEVGSAPRVAQRVRVDRVAGVQGTVPHEGTSHRREGVNVH